MGGTLTVIRDSDLAQGDKLVAYDPHFLGDDVEAPLPTFGAALDGHIYRSDDLRDGVFADYPTFSVVMNTHRRSAAFVALNIDQSHLGGKGSKSWTYDSRVDRGAQLNNEYYRNNVWDRGHLARRASAAWGANEAEKNRNSRETYYWTNAALQHAWVNQDEWLGVEEWVRTLNDDANNKVCSISGPIYSEIHSCVEPAGRNPAAVPNAFFKVVMFRHRDSHAELSVRAFIVPQNAATMRADGEWQLRDLQLYQVPVMLIEQHTGLIFPDPVVQANPLFFSDTEGAHNVGNPPLPETHPVDVDTNIIDPGDLRPDQGTAEATIRIAAAMVNPVGHEPANEWVSLINVGAGPVSITGWRMIDHNGRTHHLPDSSIEPGVAIRMQPVADMHLRNRSGSITLRNASGNRIDRAFWIGEEGRREGKPIVFMAPDRFFGA